MRVLFVDDEPRVLEGLERILLHLAGEWDMAFVASGKDALVEMEKQPFDVIVTDMRMPGMDGAELLQIVYRRYPETVRVVLSGHAELEAALRTVPVAHQFLSKPCKPEVLEDAVIRARGLQALLADHDLRKAVGQVEKLPSVPKIYGQLTKALADLNTDVNDVAHIVGQDPAMCAKVLQLVNSAFFSRGVRCTDVGHAVMRLGLQMIKSLVLTIEVFRIPRGGQKVHGFSIEDLQDNAMRTGALARQMFTDKSVADDAFTAAVLHDIGQLIMVVELPGQMGVALSRAQEEGRQLYEVEKEILGTTHAEIGAYLLGIWGLPYPIVEAVANHHEPQRVSNRLGFGVLDAVYVAESLTKGLELDMDYLAGLGVEGQVDRWREMFESLQPQ